MNPRFSSHNGLIALVLGIGLASANACDPCAGMARCRVQSQVSAEGTFILHRTGEPVPGVRLEFRRVGGVPLDTDVIGVVTDAMGRYHFRVGALERGEAIFRVRVDPPRHPAYEVEQVRLPTSEVWGDGVELGRWVVDPYLALVGEVRDRRTGRIPPWDGGAGRAIFRRTGGALLAQDSVVVPIDPGGRFFLLLEGREFGEVVGTVTLVHKAYPRPYVFREVQIRPEHRDVPVELGGVFYLGPSLNYAGAIFRRGAPADFSFAGYQVEFRRTGGLLVSPAEFRRPVQPWGGFSLATDPEGDGTVQGQLVVIPPSGFPRDTIPISMTTFDGNEQRLLGRWGVGPSLNYAGEIYLRNAGKQLPLAGAEVQFRRTGGIRVQPDTFWVRTEPWGGFSLGTMALEEGLLHGELLVRLPQPRGERVIRDLRLSTFKSDEQRFMGRWGLGAQINYGAEIFYLSTRQPVAGVEVRFVRKGGIRVRPDTLVQVTTPWGGIALQLETEEEGEVWGDLIVMLPPPKGPVTFGGIRLPTFEADDFRFLGSFWIP